MNSTPPEYFFHIVETDTAIKDLVHLFYASPTELNRQHFRLVNSHLKGDIARPGQIVLVSPGNASQCTEAEILFNQVALEVDAELTTMNKQEAEILAKRYDLINSTASYSGLLLGISNTYWSKHTDRIKGVLESIEKDYVKTYNRTGKLNSQAFLQLRQMKFQELNQLIGRMFDMKQWGLQSGNMKQVLGLSTKSILHNWRTPSGSAQNIPGYGQHYREMSKLAKTLKRVGYLGIALDGVQSVAEIQKACSVPDRANNCTKTKFTEGGRFAGSVVGGTLGGFAGSYLACNAVFGVPSGASSLLWCGIVTGAVGGYVGGKYGSGFGKDLGDLLYNTTVNLRQ
jgi:hypothetical protein